MNEKNAIKSWRKRAAELAESSDEKTILSEIASWQNEINAVHQNIHELRDNLEEHGIRIATWRLALTLKRSKRSSKLKEEKTVLEKFGTGKEEFE